MRIGRAKLAVALLTGWAAVAGAPVAALADMPQTMAFQGLLTDPDGQPLNGTFSATFRIFDAAAGGTALWSEAQTLSVAEGLFSALLGAGTPLNLAFDRSYWVEIQVGAETLLPRQPLAAGPYAMRAKKLDGIHVSENGFVGIGTTAPEQRLEVAGNIYANSGGTGLVLVGRGAAENYGGLQLLTGGVPRWTVGPRNDGTDHFHVFDDTSGVSRLVVRQWTGNVGVGTADPSQKLEVNGALRLAPTGAPASPQAGTVYYDSATNHFYGWNGSAWKQLDN